MTQRRPDPAYGGTPAMAGLPRFEGDETHQVV